MDNTNKDDVAFTIDKLTSITDRIWVSNYIILFNTETNKLRIFDKNKVDSLGKDLKQGELFNSEDNGK